MSRLGYLCSLLQVCRTPFNPHSLTPAQVSAPALDTGPIKRVSLRHLPGNKAQAQGGGESTIPVHVKIQAKPGPHQGDAGLLSRAQTWPLCGHS
jgi:hypothetical protein